MGNFKFEIIFIVLLIALPSCKKFEIKGFLTTYEIVDHRFEQSMEYNNRNGYTEIDIAQNNYDIFAMSDSHVGETENLEKFFKNAKNQKSTAVVMLGDLTTGNEDDYNVLSRIMPSKDSLMYFPIVGNHDLYFDGWKNFYSIFGSSSYFFVINTPENRDLFICLDTGGGTLGKKQLEWFINLLETDRDKYRYCVVFTHINIYRLRQTTSTNPMLEEVHVLTDLFIRHKINMVVSGHDHKRNSAFLGNTTIINLDALQDENKNASYLKLSINENNIDYNFVEI